MAEKKPDRRVLKTKKAIRNALALLLSEKELEDISIKDVADAADINRKTFYNYYSGIHEVIDEIENEIISACDWAIQGLDIWRDMKRPYIFFEKFTAVLNRDLEFYGYLMKMRGNLSLAYKLTALLKGKIREAFLQQVSCEKEKADIIIDYAVTGMIAVYQTWFNAGRRQPIEEISEMLSILCFSGISGVLEMEA